MKGVEGRACRMANRRCYQPFRSLRIEKKGTCMESLEFPGQRQKRCRLSLEQKEKRRVGWEE